MVDKTYYNNKPTGAEVGAIQNRLKATDITIKDLAKELIEGASFRPSFLMGKKETDWISQQIFALDFDNGTTIDEELNRCRELNILPIFAYTSFSHSKEHHKFRLVFCMDSIINDYDTAKQIQSILMGLFNKSDKQCSNIGRLYFGGRDLVYEDYDNMIDYKNMLTVYDDILSNNKLGVLGVQDKDNIYNINYIRYPKNPLTDNEDINYNIQAIKEHNIDTSKLYYI
jgi:hypothetical protein